MKPSIETFFAVSAPGLEPVCAEELTSLGMREVRCIPGGVEFAGNLRDLYRANLWLRTASRVLVRVGEFRCRDFPELFRRGARLPWGRFIPPGTPVEVRVSSHRSRLMHTGRIGETVAEAVARALGTPLPEGKGQLVLVRIEEDLCRISVDSSGELLHRRGYRLHAGPAPLRETLAAGILHLLGWNGRTPLFDPMCGSGTFLIEGALLAQGRPPGVERRFAFMEWPGWRPGLWQALLHEAGQAASFSFPPIHGSDRDAAVLEICRQNAERAGVLPFLQLHPSELKEARPPSREGLLLCNPPYGGRLSDGEDLVPLFRVLGEVSRRFSGWQFAFLSPDDRLTRATGVPVRVVARLVNGGIPVSLVAGRV